MPGPRKKTPPPPRAAATKARTAEDFETFLAYFSGSKGIEFAANLTRSADAAGFNRSTIYGRRRDDPEFAAKYDEAYAQGYDLLEEACQKRAFSGFEENVWYQGKVVGKERRFSDTLAMFLLKGRKSEVFRDRVETITPPASERRFEKLSNEELEAELKKRLGNG